MTEEQILEGNRLIAEFMGAVPEQWYPDSPQYGMTGVHYSYPTSGEYPDNVRHHAEQLLHYHNNWNWIMPACYKWDNLDWKFFTTIEKELDYIFYCSKLDNASTAYDIEAVYEQLVKCIKWYNTLTKPQ